jgi:hypothetical protein
MYNLLTKNKILINISIKYFCSRAIPVPLDFLFGVYDTTTPTTFTKAPAKAPGTRAFWSNIKPLTGECSEVYL